MTVSTLPRIAILSLVMVLAACGGRGGSGGYYSSDGPPRNPPSNLDAIPDAVPRIEPLARGPNRPYTIMGRSYVPDTSGQAYRRRGVASWYGTKFHGSPTSSGERYDMYAMTAAHTTLPIPSYVRVTRVANGRSVIVRVNDRGPFLHDRVIDLSYVAAHRLGIIGPGSGEVIVERITPDEIRSGTWNRGNRTMPVQASNMVAEGIEPPGPRMAAQVRMVSSTPPPSATQSQQVYLQLGAFRDETNARSLASRTAASMPSQMPVEVDQSVPEIYRVRVGPFANRDVAMQAITLIYQSLGVMPTISQR